MYELPRCENGSIDWTVLSELHENGLLDDVINDVFISIDYNARTEEREDKAHSRARRAANAVLRNPERSKKAMTAAGRALGQRIKK